MGIRKMNRKGMVFTILTVFLMSLFFVVYSLHTYETIKEKTRTVEKRIETMNNFVYFIQKDLERRLYIAGYRAIFVLEDKINREGHYIDDVQTRMQELITNGTLEGQTQEIMSGANLKDIIENINSLASKMNVDVNLTNTKISIFQDNPWTVKIQLNSRLLVKDKGNLSLWNKTITLYSQIPIENFEDPLYTIETRGLISRRINRTIFWPFRRNNNIENFTAHLENHLYINSSLAPSFLNRLEGNLSADPNGIESLVYIPDLVKQNIEPEQKSIVDYIYFSSENPTSYLINNTYGWVRLDEDHITYYNLTGLTH